MVEQALHLLYTLHYWVSQRLVTSTSIETAGEAITNALRKKFTLGLQYDSEYSGKGTVLLITHTISSRLTNRIGTFVGIRKI